jgi:hypothetical protein
VNVFERIGRAIGRLNRWLGPAAVASSVENTPGVSTGPTVNPAAVTTLLGETERRVEGETEPEPEPGSTDETPT